MEVIKNLQEYLDHTLLDCKAGSEDILNLCEEAKEFAFSSVCVFPCHVQEAAFYLKDSDVKVTTVVGFPYGATLSEVKLIEAMRVVDKGADEVDMVINLGYLKNGDEKGFLNDIYMGVQGAGDAPLKAIIETGLLTDDEKKRSAELAVQAGASFIKTCTGVNCGTAKVDDIKLLREVVGNNIGIKASGGIKTYDQAFELVEAGADKIGSSSCVKIIRRE